MAEQDIKTQVTTQVMEAAKDQVARKIIENWNILHLVMPDNFSAKPPSVKELLGDPTAKEGTPEHTGIAAQFITEREAIIGKKTIKLTAIDIALDEFVEKRDNEKYKKTRDVTGKVNDLVPTNEALTEIADATNSGIESQQSWGNQFWSFLSAIFTWLASVISSMFTGGEPPAMSFNEALAQTAAPGVRDAVHSKLQALATDPDKKSSKLLNTQDENGHSTLDTITDMVHKRSYEKLSGKSLPEPSTSEGQPTPSPNQRSVPLDELKPTAGVSRGDIRTEIYTKTMNPTSVDGTKQEPLADQIYKQLKANKDKSTLGRWSVKDNDLKNIAISMADTIATTLSDRISNPEFDVYGQKLNEMTPQNFSKVLANEVGKELLAKKASFGVVGTSFEQKIGGNGIDKDKTNIDIIKEQAQQALMDNYDQLTQALDMLAITSPETLKTKLVSKSTTLEPIDSSLTPKPLSELEKLKVMAVLDNDGVKDDKASLREIRKLGSDVNWARQYNKDNNKLITNEEQILTGSSTKLQDSTIKSLRDTLSADKIFLAQGINLSQADPQFVMNVLKTMGVETHNSSHSGKATNAPKPKKPNSQSPD